MESNRFVDWTRFGRGNQVICVRQSQEPYWASLILIGDACRLHLMSYRACLPMEESSPGPVSPRPLFYYGQ